MKLPIPLYILVLCFLGRVSSQGDENVPTATPGPDVTTEFPTVADVNNVAQEAEDPKGSWFENDPDDTASAAGTAPPANDDNNNDASAPNTTSTTEASQEEIATATLDPGILPVQLPGTSANSSESETASLPPSDSAPEPANGEPSDAPVNDVVSSAPTTMPSKDTAAEPGEGDGEGDGDDWGNEDTNTEGEGNDKPDGEEKGTDDGYKGEEGTDDEFGGEEEYEGGWQDPEDEETKAPYVPPVGDDPFANTPDETLWTGGDWKQESPEEMMHDKNVIIAVSCTVAFGFILAIITAQQVIENPDGFCARCV